MHALSPVCKPSRWALEQVSLGHSGPGSTLPASPHQVLGTYPLPSRRIPIEYPTLYAFDTHSGTHTHTSSED